MLGFGCVCWRIWLPGQTARALRWVHSSGLGYISAFRNYQIKLLSQNTVFVADFCVEQVCVFCLGVALHPCSGAAPALLPHPHGPDEVAPIPSPSLKEIFLWSLVPAWCPLGTAVTEAHQEESQGKALAVWSCCGPSLDHSFQTIFFFSGLRGRDSCCCA